MDMGLKLKNRKVSFFTEKLCFTVHLKLKLREPEKYGL